VIGIAEQYCESFINSFVSKPKTKNDAFIFAAVTTLLELELEAGAFFFFFSFHHLHQSHSFFSHIVAVLCLGASKLGL
jgi:hypothetical protein